MDGGKSGSSMMSKKEQKRMKNKIKTAVKLDLEKEFDKAEFKGKPMGLCDSMPEYLVWVTKQQSDLVDKIPEESRPGYPYFGPDVLAKTIMKTKTTPSDYITTLQQCKT